MLRTFVILMIGYLIPLMALPSGAHDIQGDVSINSGADGHSLDISSHGKAIIHWESFDIASNQSVSFSQAHAQNAILNRVTGGSKSYILGKLSANCPLFIVNEKGIVFGSTAQLETAGFLASTANISNESFLGGGDLVLESVRGGSIVNLGKIISHEGDIILVARFLENHGTLQASQGSVVLTTTEMALDMGSKHKVFIRLGEEIATEEGIQNSGDVKALSIDFVTHSPYEKAIRHSGTIEASTTKKENGRIYLVAENGSIDIETSLSAPGGEIAILGKNVHLSQQATVDVSSESRGGTILVGGDFQGENAYANTVHIAPGVSLLANATDEGDGGKVIVWSEEATLFEGTAEVCGGLRGGNGGLIEVSARGEMYEVSRSANFNAKAPQGKVGDILFDPQYVYIAYNGTDPATGQTFSTNPTGTAIISGDTLGTTINSANVTIQANTDIVFMDTVEATTLNRELTLQAGRSIQFLDGSLILNNGAFSATINDSGAQSANREAGVASFYITDGVIHTQGGNITVSVGTFGGSQVGEVSISSSSLDAGGGDVSLTGIGRHDGSNYSLGVSVGDLAEIKTSGSGTITIHGTGGNGTKVNHGIYFNSSDSLVQVDSGELKLTGVGGGDGTGTMNTGITSAACLKSTGTGPITLNGTSGIGTNMNSGINLQGTGAKSGIQTVDGPVTLAGMSHGTGMLNAGIRFESGTQCSSTGSGTITLTGTAGEGTTNNHGVILSSGFITSASAPVSVVGEGKGSGDYNYGVRLETGSRISSTDTATISIEGTGSAGLACNSGISLATSPGGIFTKNGNVTLNGTSSGSGAMNQGVSVEGGIIQSTGVGKNAGIIQIIGVGGPGINQSNGVSIKGKESSGRVTSVDGDIKINGTAYPGNQPISIIPTSSVNTTGSGVIDERSGTP